MEFYIKKLLALVQEAQSEGFGEVIFKVVIQNGKVSMVHLSKTQTLKADP